MGLGFEFATASRIVFGTGSRRMIGELVAGYGRQVLWVTGASDRHTVWLSPQLEAA